jgi:N utilization substance protein B
VLRDATRYAQELVRGVLENRAAIDGMIQQRAPLWPLAQMSAVDRNVLRIGLYESLYGNATVPLRTAINEAVELAKLFGSETSAKFVNGVLGRAVEASGNSESPQHASGASDTTTHPATQAG